MKVEKFNDLRPGKNYTLSIGAEIRRKGLPSIGDKITAKEAVLFKDNYATATVSDVKSEDVNKSGNIKHTVTTDLGVAEVWDHEIIKS